MSIRFAGSRCVDERRRRRLAQEADAASGESTDHSTDEEGVEAADEAAALEAQSRADTLITPKLWKHVVLALCVTIAWAGMLLVGDRADAGLLPMAGILGLQQGKLATFFSTVMLLAAGQLSLINLWYRSRSRKDFSGSYKLWFYAAFCWLTFCAATATGVHVTMADSILRDHPIAVWKIQTLLWLVPAAIMLLPLSKLLLREMRDCRGSSRLLKGSLFVTAFGMTVHLFGELLLSAREQALWSTALATGWQMLLAISMLTHARHVIHVSNEAPKSPLASGGGLVATTLTWLFAPVIKGERQTADATATDASGDDSEETVSGSKSRSETKKKRTTTSSSNRKSTSKRGTTSTKSKSAQQKASVVESDDEGDNVESDDEVESASSETANDMTELADAIAKSGSTADDYAQQDDARVESAAPRRDSAKTEARQSDRVQRFDAPQAVKGPKSSRRATANDDEEDADEASYADDDASATEEASASRLDAESLKGLSKKERRELQRKHKQMQRQSGR